MSATTPGSPAGAGGRKLKVLVVDDQPDTARMLQLFVATGGHEVQKAGNVADALKIAEQQAFDILVCDIKLPDGSGYDLIQELRARSPIKGIVFSGLSGLEQAERSLAAGFSEHLVKPNDLDRLLETIQRVAAE